MTRRTRPGSVDGVATRLSALMHTGRDLLHLTGDNHVAAMVRRAPERCVSAGETWLPTLGDPA